MIKLIFITAISLFTVQAFANGPGHEGNGAPKAHSVLGGEGSAGNAGN